MRSPFLAFQRLMETTDEVLSSWPAAESGPVNGMELPTKIVATEGITMGWVGALRALGEVKSSAFFSLPPQAASGSTSSKPIRDAARVSLGSLRSVVLLAKQ